MQFLNYGTIPIGAVLGGTLATAVGVHEAMWIMTGTLALTPLLVGPLRRQRELPDHAPGSVGVRS